MFDAAETKAGRCDRMLGELSELAMAVARDLAGRVQAAETPEQATQLALAFHRVSRSLRQTLALEARMERDRQAEAKASAADALAQAERSAEPPPRSPFEGRKNRVRGALSRLLWDEAERDEDEYQVLVDDLEARLYEASLREDFHDMPIESLILQIKQDMRLGGELVLTACKAPAPRPATGPATGPPCAHAPAAHPWADPPDSG